MRIAKILTAKAADLGLLGAVYFNAEVGSWRLYRSDGHWTHLGCTEGEASLSLETTTMTTIEAMTADLRSDGTITSLNDWRGGPHHRTYLRVAGYRDDYRGCRAHKIYWDHVAGELISSPFSAYGAPRDYLDAVDKVVTAFAEPEHAES